MVYKILLISFFSSLIPKKNGKKRIPEKQTVRSKSMGGRVDEVSKQPERHSCGGWKTDCFPFDCFLKIKIFFLDNESFLLHITPHGRYIVGSFAG